MNQYTKFQQNPTIHGFDILSGKFVDPSSPSWGGTDPDQIWGDRRIPKTLLTSVKIRGGVGLVGIVVRP